MSMVIGRWLVEVKKRYSKFCRSGKLGVEKMRKFGVVVKLKNKGKGLPSCVTKTRRTRI